MAKFEDLYGDLNNFHDYYVIDPATKCWNWQPAVFRLRTGMNTHNPRRLAIQLTGRVIPVRKNLTTVCGNERCVNPDHIRLKETGAPVEEGEPLYFEDETVFQLSNTNIANRYATTVEEAAKARKRTLDLVYYVLESPLPPAKIAKKYKIAVSFVKYIINNITPEKWIEMQMERAAPISEGSTSHPRIKAYKWLGRNEK